MPDDARTLIVTGASSGIGYALALRAARDGYRVVAVARRSRRLDELATEIRNNGETCVVVAGDVTTRDMPARIVATAVQNFGRIDVLVNNAGGGTYGALLEESDAAIEAQWQLNVAAPLRIARAALRALETTRGQLVFVGSGSARIPLPNYGAYAPTKAAIRAAAIQLRRELRTRGIAVNVRRSGIGRDRVSLRYRHRARAADSRRIAGSRRARDSARDTAPLGRGQRRALADRGFRARRVARNAHRSARRRALHASTSSAPS